MKKEELEKLTTWDKIFNFIFEAEGEYSNDPSDRGGETAWGITKKFLEDLKEDLKIDKIDQQTAKKLYKKFFSKYNLDKISKPSIRFFVCDCAILLGPHRAVSIAQRVCNEIGIEIKVDGVCGPRTLAALAVVDVKKFLRIATWRVVEFHINTALASWDQKRFLRGWINRANRRQATALEMADE